MAAKYSGEYTLIRSQRKTIAVQIRDGRVVVRAPMRMPVARIEDFLLRKKAWIDRHLSPCAPTVPLSAEEHRALILAAQQIIPERVAHYAPLVGVTYGRITIRSQRTRWGSCSSSGNLNFNCLLMLAPIEVLDSVVVHELCHLKEMNHSAAFYREVLRVFPAYEHHHGWLKAHGSELLSRLPRQSSC